MHPHHDDNYKMKMLYGQQRGGDNRVISTTLPKKDCFVVILTTLFSGNTGSATSF